MAEWSTHPKTGQRLLAPLRPSRRAVTAGDVFVLRPDDEYLFGSIVRTDVSLDGGVIDQTTRSEVVPKPGKYILVYVFEGRSHTPEPPANLRERRLLIPPAITNRQGWLRGYFETVGRVEPPIDRGPHTFLDIRRREPRYYDEHGARLLGPGENMGTYYLAPFELIACDVHDALGRGPESRA